MDASRGVPSFGTVESTVGVKSRETYRSVGYMIEWEYLTEGLCQSID